MNKILKLEYGLKMNIYLNTEESIETELDKGYYICECMSKCLSSENYVDFYMHSSKMNEDVENELSISVTFYVKSTTKTESEVIEEFLSNIKDNIANINKDIVYDESVTIQVHECFISE